LHLDFTSFVNSNAALVLGLVIACGTTTLVRSVGAEWTAYRLLRSGWADIVAVARRPEGADVTGLLYRMVDRLGLVAPRIAMIPAESVVAQTDVLRDLRNGLNTIELQRHKQLVTRDNRAAIDDVLSGVAAHYQEKQKRRDAVPGENLRKTLDQSLSAFIDLGKSSAADGARRAMTSLRYTLYPEVAAFAFIVAGSTEAQVAKENAA
jgi:uncharacterized membrane protein YccC